MSLIVWDRVVIDRFIKGCIIVVFMAEVGIFFKRVIEKGLGDKFRERRG